MYNLCCTSSKRNVAKPENRLVFGKSRYICSASVASAAWGKIQSHADSLQGLWEIGQTKISKKRYLRFFARFYGRTPANHLGCIKPCNKINWISIGARFLNHPQSNWLISYSTHQWVGSLLDMMRLQRLTAGTCKMIVSNKGSAFPGDPFQKKFGYLDEVQDVTC